MERTMMKKSVVSRLFVGLVVLFFCAVLAAPVLASNLILDLGVLSGGTSSTAFDVSADGTVVVGTATDAAGYDHAFRWTQANGMSDLGTLPGGVNTLAYAVSADGTTIVGQAKFASGNTEHAFRWTQMTGMVDLGGLPGGSNSIAQGVSKDGSVVVGMATDANGHNHAFRWTQAGGMQDLGTLGGNTSVAYAVNADGTVVVGEADLSSGSQSHAFRWTQAGMIDLGTLGGLTSSAFSVSQDGSVVVGYAADNIQVTPDYHAVRWTVTGTTVSMLDLGTLGGTDSIANGVSADGSVVVGQSTPASGGYEAIYWTQATGMQTVNQWLTANAINSSSFSFSNATAVSANGKTVVGQLTNSHAFVALSCYSLNPPYFTIGPAGGNIPVCASNASNNPGWITISGNGTGTVQLAISANNSTFVRSTPLTVDGQIFTVLQGTASQQAKIGVFRNGGWYQDYPATGTWVGCGAPTDPTKDICSNWGMTGDIPVMGDWDGTGITRIGVFRNGWWYLDINGNNTWDPGVDLAIPFGMAGDIPVVGNWNGSADGKSKIGVFRNGTWYLDYPGTGSWIGCGAPNDPTKDACMPFGLASDIPVVGNWNGSADGKSKIGVFRNGTWYLDYPGTGAWIGCGAPAMIRRKTACIPLAWQAISRLWQLEWGVDGKSKIGVFRNGTWYLDYPALAHG